MVPTVATRGVATGSARPRAGTRVVAEGAGSVECGPARPEIPMAAMFKLIARFTKNGQPLTGPGYLVRFLDRDLVKDDLLGESPLGSDGEAGAVCAGASALSLDSPGERRPDVYCVLYLHDTMVYRGETTRNVDFDAPRGPAAQAATTIDLGTFDIA